ncbi:hypothetical protein ST47_g9375 [Ascochyta rabiei]|uniref:Uncharacterized protein n=1 Tax=Didymella rabiei TaxID=5454 RepID=A0A162XCA6_DIDRA|nr:hypothetical protein ST47_g9375 [Ascochyta rabiei]
MPRWWNQTLAMEQKNDLSAAEEMRRCDGDGFGLGLFAVATLLERSKIPVLILVYKKPTKGQLAHGQFKHHASEV